VPQAPRLNRGLWEGIEAALRTMVRQQGVELFVVTGPVFAGAELQALQSRVLIPTSVWKAVYDPAAATTGAYYPANTDDGTIRWSAWPSSRTCRASTRFRAYQRPPRPAS
jgi:endonuclease G